MQSCAGNQLHHTMCTLHVGQQSELCVRCPSTPGHHAGLLKQVANMSHLPV